MRVSGDRDSAAAAPRRALAALLLLATWLPAAVAAPVPAPPELGAVSWIIQDHHSGQVIAEHDADRRVEPASLTKMLTVYVVFAEMRAGKIAMDDQVLVSAKAWKMPGSRMFIEVDTRVSVEDLVKGVIIQSGNDASVALAEHVAGDESAFGDLMNQYADKEFVYNGISQPNRNSLLWQDESVDGLKTGYTESAGYCLVASAAQDGMRLVSVIMGSDSPRSRARQSRALLAYGFRFFETHRLYEAGKPVQDVRVWKGARETVSLGLAQDLYVTVPRGQYQRLDPKMVVDARLEAPLVEGDVRGDLKVQFDGQLVAERPLVVLETVTEGNLWQRASDSVRLWFQ